MVRRAGLQFSYHRLVSQCGCVTKIASFSHVSEKAAHDFASPSLWQFSYDQILARQRDGAHLLGRTENNRVINILIPPNDIAHPQADSWIGEMLDVKVTEVLKHTLRGELAYVPA